MMTIACKDLGMNCKNVCKGMDWDGLMADCKKHAMEVHKMTEADMTPEMIEKMKQVMKQK